MKCGFWFLEAAALKEWICLSWSQKLTLYFAVFKIFFIIIIKRSCRCNFPPNKRGRQRRMPCLNVPFGLVFLWGAAYGRSDRGKWRHKLTKISRIVALPNCVTYEDPCGAPLTRGTLLSKWAQMFPCIKCGDKIYLVLMMEIYINFMTSFKRRYCCCMILSPN